MDEFEAREWMKGLSFGIGDDSSFGERDFGKLRSEEEILIMIERSRERMDFYRLQYLKFNKKNDRSGMLNAARNFKALQGVHQALLWVLSEESVDHPLY